MTRKNRRILATIALLLSFVMLLTGCQGLFDKLGLGKSPTTEATYEQTQPTQKTEPPTTEPEEETIPVQTLPPETEPPVVYYWVQAEGGLNVRSGPGQNYETVGRLDNGTRICPERWQNGWAYIVSPVVGWCSGEYLYSDRPDYMGDGSYRWVHGDGAVRLYEGPGTEYREIGQLDAGVMVYPLRWEGKWVYIEINDYYTGWCRDNYLSTHDPFPIEDARELVSTKAPNSSALVGKWMVVSNYTEYSSENIMCRAGVIELKSDGTFIHMVYDYMKWYEKGKTVWYCPGGETSGCDCPYWVGEYTYDGKNLVLKYRGEHVSEYYYDETGFPMPVDYHWNPLQKNVSLKVTITEDGFTVDAPGTIPVHTYNTKGDSSTVATLYRADSRMDSFDIPPRLLPIYYP